jgi:transcriptional regulator
MITTGGFQDLVQLSLDTLYMLGPMFQVGDSIASTVTVGFSNSGGTLALAAQQTANALAWFPTNLTTGTLLTNINVSAGTTSANVSAITFSNANNVSFGYDGTNITASINVSAANINISAGTTSNESSAFVFSNSNNVSFGINGGTITASVNAISAINVSAGTTSNNLTNVVFSNSNNATFGLNGSTVTVSAPINFSAGTTSNNLTQLSFSNGSGITFGLNGGTLTASVNAITAINVSAGTTSNNLTAVTFSNSNGIRFGLNGSVITAALGGISSWSNGVPATALTGGQNTLFFMPIIVPYNITVTNLLWLASVSNKSSNVSGGLSVSAALYSLNGGTALSLASSGSTNITWTSGAPLSSFTGINYQQMSLNSWSITPGPYLFAWWVSTQGSATVSYYGNPQQPVISSGMVAAMSNLMLNGYSQATTNALPASFGITNTASYIRTGATAAEQPYIIFQGT